MESCVTILIADIDIRTCLEEENNNVLRCLFDCYHERGDLIDGLLVDVGLVDNEFVDELNVAIETSKVERCPSCLLIAKVGLRFQITFGIL